MADMPEVKPGDLITAEQMNAMIRAINTLNQQAASTGTVTVPVLIGLSIGAMRTLLALPGTQLTVGVILDATGIQLDALDSKVQSRLVINQMPPAGNKVLPGTTVTL